MKANVSVNSRIFLAVLLSVTTFIPITAPAGEVRFWEMPKGCSWTTEYSNGNVWVNTFRGKQAGKYIVTTKNKFGSKEKVKTTEYNARGLMTRSPWSGNKWEEFEPYSCFGIVGDCTYTYRNADGVTLVISSKTTQINNSTFRVKAKSGQTGKFAVDTVQKTHYGLTLLSKNKNFSVKTTELRNCGIAPS